MKLYRFKTFRTSYYFPEVNTSCKFLYGLYHPYGNVLVKLYFRMFKHLRIFRNLFVINSDKADFDFAGIVSKCPEGALLSFNMGTPGEEQKISILGYIPSTGDSFFAKYSTKEKAIVLSQNEIKTLKLLKDTGLSPQLLSVELKAGSVFFLTSRIAGTLYEATELNAEIIHLLIEISGISHRMEENRKEGFSHGDFCPWNMLEEGGRIRLIDWEMASVRPLGYDLFTFVFHVKFILEGDKVNLENILLDNRGWFSLYFDAFGIADYMPYLKEYVKRKLNSEKQKQHHRMVENLLKLERIIHD